MLALLSGGSRGDAADSNQPTLELPSTGKTHLLGALRTQDGRAQPATDASADVSQAFLNFREADALSSRSTPLNTHHSEWCTRRVAMCAHRPQCVMHCLRDAVAHEARRCCEALEAGERRPWGTKC